MSENNFTDEIFVYPPEKQKELYELVSAAFSEELKDSNCFILSEVSNRTGVAMYEKGFEKIDASTFSAAPEYFISGYNEENADAISLIGYPADARFSTTPIEKSAPMSKKEKNQLTSEQQKRLAEIFVENFKKSNKNGKVYLAAVGSKAGKQIAQEGFGRVCIDMFKNATDYFEYSQDTKGNYIVYLKENCGIDMPKKETKQNTTKTVDVKESKQFEDALFAKLKRNYKTNDVSASDILLFLKQKRILLPQSVASFEELIDIMVAKFGGVFRDNGKGTNEEYYITLRKPLPIPQEIYDRVELIVSKFFLNKDLITNSEVGQVLRNNGIIYKDYDYADLTAFLRYFTDIFRIVPQSSGNNRVTIFVRIVPSFREKYATPETQQKTRIEIPPAEFEKVICEMFEAGKYTEIIHQDILRDAIKHSGYAMWESIVKAYLIINGANPENLPSFSDWEKEVFDFEHLSSNATDEFLSSFAFGKDKIAQIQKYILDYTHKTFNYNILAQIIQNLCGEENYLVGVMLNLGLIARIQGDKSFCFRLLMMYYARNEDDTMWELWEKHAESCLSASGISIILGMLFVEKEFGIILTITEKYSELCDPIETVQLYKEYAEILLGKSNNKLPSLSAFDNKRSTELVLAFLEYAQQEQKIELYTEMIYNCVKAQSNYVPIASLNDTLNCHSEFLNQYYPTLIQKAEEKDRVSLIVIRQLIGLEIVPACDKWTEINETLLDEYKTKVKESLPENKEAVLYEAIELLPTESCFVDELVSIIKKNNSSDGNNLEDFINNMVDKGNFEQVIMLYEHNVTPEIRDQVWFLHKLSHCYQSKQEPKKSLDAEMMIIASQLNAGEDVYSCLTQLITILYTGFVSRTLISLDKETALRVFSLFDHYKCEPISAHQYWIAMMGLALCTKNIPLLSLLYCLDKGTKKEAAFLESCEDEIQESELGYKYRFGDLTTTFDYVLTQEKMDTIFTILGRAANTIRQNKEDEVYYNFRNGDAGKITPEKIVTLVIADYTKERAWRLLSEYAYKSKKVTLTFVANSVWYFRFKDTSFALGNCTKSLGLFIDNVLPRNLLWCSLAIWCANVDNAGKGFKREFINHIRRHKTFQNANPEMVEDWYDMLRNKNKPEEIDLLLATEIAKQTTSFDTLCKIIFSENTAYQTMLSNTVAPFVLFCSAFVYCADIENFQKVFWDIKELRNKVGASNISKNDRSALLWIDDLISNRNGDIADDYFQEASMAILSSYPNPPSNDIIDKWITPDSLHRLPNYSLLRNWINTFGNAKTVNKADYEMRVYGNNNYLSDDEEERKHFFKILYFIAEKHIVFYDRLHPNTNSDFFRRCTAYYGLRKITASPTQIPADFKDKMYKDLESLNKLDQYLNYQAGVDAFADAVDDDFIRERFIYCGITNYWDKTLDACLKNTNKLIANQDAIEDYFKAIDYKPIRRRLLQMYVYASAGQIMAEDEVLVPEAIAKIEEVQNYYNYIINSNIDINDYLASVRRLIEILQPSLVNLINLTENADDQQDKMNVIQNIIFVLSNKELKKFRLKVANVEEEYLSRVVIPALIAIQTSQDISHLLLQMSLNGEKYIETMLESEPLVSAIGNYEVNLFKSILYLNQGDFEAATSYLSAAGSSGNTYKDLYNALTEAIANQTSLDITENFGKEKQPQTSLPRLSFMKTSDPAGMGLNQLVADFYDEKLHDAKGKCMVASKILSLMEEGATYNDAVNLIFDWGFVEIEATFDIEKKADILFELLENIDQLKDIKNFKERFVRNFIYVLEEFNFAVLAKKFNRVFENHNVLYKKFSPYDNCDCYASAISTLSNLYNLSQENTNPYFTINEVKKSKADILTLHTKYPQNRFATKCITFAELFSQQISGRGMIEVKILNQDKKFARTVYYQVRNIGYELVSNLSLTFSIEGFPTSIERIQINSIIPTGLRPGQVYAGEYSPDITVEDGTEIGCSVFVEYTTIDDETEVSNSYTVIDSATDGKLFAHTTEEPVYSKAGGAEYFEQKITEGRNLIGRISELEKILGSILNGQNVLLYGTNGTGKSSVLNAIRTKYLPAILRQDPETELNLSVDIDPNDKFLCLQIECDANCSEKNVIETLIDRMKYEFPQELSSSTKTEAENKLAQAIHIWDQEKTNIFDSDGNCTNTGIVKTCFNKIDEALQLNNIHVFYLIDQFERVLASDKIDEKHMLFLRDFHCTNIKMILAGSNEVLEAVAIADQDPDKIARDSWSDILSRGFQTKKIGNMSREDFDKLMNQPRALNKGKIKYSDEALDYLYQFTNGHALYSCLLGNRTLDIMSNRKVARNIIYPSDIFIAIYQARSHLTAEQSKTDKEATIIKQIFQDIFDNTAVKYVGKILAEFQSKGERKVSYQKLKYYIQEYRPDILVDFDNALAILLARDFISFDVIDIQHQSKQTRDENKKTANEYFFTSDLYLEHFAEVYVPEISTQDQEKAESKKRSLEALEAELRLRTFEEIEELRNRLPTMFKGPETRVIHTGNYYEGDNKSNNFTINAQTINTTFSTLISDASTLDKLEAFNKLPKLKDFYTVEEDIRMKELQAARPVLFDKASAKVYELDDNDIVLIDEIEDINTQAQNRYYSEMASTMLKQSDETPDISVFAEPTTEELKSILGIKKDSQLSLIKALPQEYYRQLCFAIALHKMILPQENEDIDYTNVDFSPISIMYCKLVENMLKDKHLELYGEALPEAKIPSGETFKKLNEKETRKKKWKNLTIGTFVWHLIVKNVTITDDGVQNNSYFNSASNPDINKNPNIEKLSTATGKDIDDWRKHALAMAEILEIRNMSAHGGHTISKTVFDRLLKVLFTDEDGAIRRIWDLWKK